MVTANSIVEWLLSEDLEARMPYLLQQFPDETEESIREIAVYDPTSGKYVAWLLTGKERLGGEGPISPAVGQRVRQWLEQFERVKRLPAFTGRKDINQYTDYDDLGRAMEAASELLSKRAKRDTGLRRVAQWHGYTLWLVLNIEAAMRFAQNSRLCFCDRVRAQQYAIDEGPLYVMFKGQDKVGALSAKKRWFFDMDDQPLTGQEFKAALKLAALSGDQELAGVAADKRNQRLRELQSQLQQARERRAQERRRALLHNFNRQGVAILGNVDNYQLAAIRPTSTLVAGKLSDERKQVSVPVLGLLAADGLVAYTDLQNGTVEAPAELIPTLGRAAREWASELASQWIMNYFNTPGLYARDFENIYNEIKRKFITNREHGYTDDRTGQHIPGVGREQAEQRWQAQERRFIDYYKAGFNIKVTARLPSFAFMRMIGYQGEEP